MAASGCGVLFPSSDKEAPPITEVWSVHAVRANSVGYVSNRAKRVTIVLPSGMSSLPEASADVRDSANGNVLWTCTLTGPMTDNATQSTYYVGDFTPFTTPGSYYVAVPSLTDANGVARSAPFRIAPDVYSGLLLRSMLGLYGQRCGTAVTINVDGQSWSHGVCHEGDASQKFVETVMMDTIKPSLRGWHDAGDYGKYVTNGAFTVGMMLQAYERLPMLATLALPIPEKGGAMPDFLDEVKWELDWLLTTQADDGSVSFKVTAPSFENFIMPEQDGSRRYYTGASSAATADFAAALAQASRIYRPFDAALADTYLEKARAAWAYVKMHNASVKPDLSMFSTGGYDANQSDLDNRVWAAAELWETTGEAEYLTAFETSTAPRTIPDNFDYDNVTPLGMFTYLLSMRTGRDQTQVDTLTASRSPARTPSRRRQRGRVRARDQRLLVGIERRGGAHVDEPVHRRVAQPADAGRFQDAIAMQLDHLLGRNIYDRTQVTGIGYYPPIRPHHRPSVSDTTANPWPGLLVGGAQPDASSWQDSTDDASLNEIAINWNAPLIFAAAALLPPPSAAP